MTALRLESYILVMNSPGGKVCAATSVYTEARALLEANGLKGLGAWTAPPAGAEERPAIELRTSLRPPATSAELKKARSRVHRLSPI